MRLARVTQDSISVSHPDYRLPLDYSRGEEVELTNADFDRLEKVGAVEDAGEPQEPSEEPNEVTEEQPAEDEDAKQRLASYQNLTHDKLDQMGRKYKIKFAAGMTKKDKAAALVAAES